MICARCGRAVQDAPCEGCGQSPWLDGRYALEVAVLEEPGATRWQARRLLDGLRVDVWELRLRAGMSAMQRAALVEEAGTLRSVRHPSLARTLDVFEGPSGPHAALFVVSEHVEGTPLTATHTEGLPPREEALRTLEEAAAVLSALHGRQPPVVHGDLRVDNLVRRARDGRLVLVRPVPPGLVERSATVRFGDELTMDRGSDLGALAQVARVLLGAESHCEALDLLERLEPLPSQERPSADHVLAQLRALRGVSPTGDEASPFEETQAMPLFADEETLHLPKITLGWVLSGLAVVVLSAAGVLSWLYLG